MSTQYSSELPVDDRGVGDVSQEEWSKDDSPARFYDLIATIPAAQEAFDAAYEAIDQRQRTLLQIRKEQQLTQAAIGQRLEMDQSEVSRLERRGDMLLSTLRSYIQAAGGELQLVASFPDSEPVRLLVGEEAVPASLQASGPCKGSSERA